MKVLLFLVFLGILALGFDSWVQFEAYKTRLQTNIQKVVEEVVP